MSFEIIHKPTFTNQLLALPRERIPQILEKVQLLADDPSPHEPVKKKLHGYKGSVFRLRSGDYRIVYTYGDGWVALLGVDDRKDIYKGGQLVAEPPAFEARALPDVGELLEPVPEPARPAARPAARGDELPVRLDDELLARLRVPEEYVPLLRACRTVDDLIAADVPEQVRERVFDAVAAPDFDRVLAQPSYLTGEVDDLLRFAEGELLDFLLKLDPDQERFVTWALEGAGPVLVKGGPGTGKSTVALYRAQALLRELRRSGVATPRILLTTYTNALVASSRQLLQRLLGPDAACLDVRTADSAVAKVLAAVDGPRPPNIADAARLRPLLKAAVDAAPYEGNALQRHAQAQTIARLSLDYLLDEIGSVIEARELDTLEAYLAAPRAGRRVPLNQTQRTAVWRVAEVFRASLARQRLETWQQMRRRAVAAARRNRADGAGEPYDAVLVDEVQDLDPTVLRLLVTICASPNRLFVTADANQSIYGSSFRWSDVHEDLRFVGRTGVVHRNYRSTRQIGEAAAAYLAAAAIDVPEREADYVQDGPLPAVRAVKTAYAETELLARYLREATRAFHLGLGACAVLAPSEATGQKLAARLRDAGVDATFMPGRQLDLEHPAVKVITLKSAKGLEFPIVALAGFLEDPRPGLPRQGTPEEIEEALLRERRTLYVAMTRAMRALLVIIPAERSSPLLTGFAAPHWNLA